MISIKYLYVIVPVLVLLIGIIWSIIPMSKKKVIKNTNTMFISTKATNKQEGTLETKKNDIETAKKKAKADKKKAKRAAEKKARDAKKKAKAARKKSKKNKRKHRTE
jgi:exopolysaccharide biosynthesis protein